MPAIPELSDAFETNLQDWMDAIATAKATSSPGVDGFTFQELKLLPKSLISSLIKYVGQLDKFPAYLMLARTIPLPKKQQLSAENSRPITILATLYRLWGRVCGQRCIRHLAQHMSDYAMGMLPKKGAHVASYKMQLELEIHTVGPLISMSLA